MSLMRWFRRNNTKIMAVVVIVLMVGFIGGSYIQQLAQRRTGQNETVAWFGADKKITSSDLISAKRELEILKAIQADGILKMVTVPIFGSPDLISVMLSALLFPERKNSPLIIRTIRQEIVANNYRISEEQINDIYRRSMGSEVYWLLLKKETEQAGIMVANENAGKTLAGLVPQLFQGTQYPQLINSLVARMGVSEKEMLATFSKLLAVLQYSRMICLNENVTIAQTMQNVSWENEVIDANLVRIDSSIFTETQKQPSQKEISEHFARYRKSFADVVTDENPYGFGYKLPDMVRLEYIAIKLDDVSKIITPTTQEETEEYYQRNRERLFTEQILSDPNDPNSLPIERIKSYAEVAETISEQLLRKKINSEPNRFMQEIKSLTETNLPVEPADISDEQFKQLAGDYEAVAKQLSSKNNIRVYTGKTGLLSATDMFMDEDLRGLYVAGYGYNPIPLGQVVFAIEQLGVSELGPFDIPKPRLHENIGPVRDILEEMVLAVRVIEARKADEPESADQSFSKKTITLEHQQAADEKVYSVKEKIIEDLKTLAAMDSAKNKAEEFIAVAAKNGWEKTIDKFTMRYVKKAKTDTDPNTFEMQKLRNLRRISSMALETLAIQSQGNSLAQIMLEARKKEDMFAEKLYSLVPQNAETIDNLPLVLEFKPALSYFCLKDISISRVDEEQYGRAKAIRAYKEDFVQSQSLSVVHLNPENIIKRTNFRLAKQQAPADANAPAKSQGAS